MKKQRNDQEQTQEQIMFTTEVTDEQNDGEDLKVTKGIVIYSHLTM